MEDKDILNVFYNEILGEALTGRIDCFRMYNIAFSYRIYEKFYKFLKEDSYPGIMVPCLCINNKELFDKLLCEYVNRALLFYDNSNYYEEVARDNRLKCKTLICSLFANATEMDYSNPVGFLERRIAMFDSKILFSEEEVCIGYSEILKGYVYVKEAKASINDETPYEISGRIVSEDNKSEFIIPTIRCSKLDNELFVYAIQSKNMIDKEDEYSKSIYDVLKHIDKGFTLSFIVPAILAISLSDCERINVIPFLVSRFNSKCILNQYKVEHYSLNEEQKQELYYNLFNLQSNLTDKFVRIFQRLEKHCQGITLDNYLAYDDRRYALNVNRDIGSNRPVVNELFNMSYSYIDSLNNKLTSRKL